MNAKHTPIFVLVDSVETQKEVTTVHALQDIDLYRIDQLVKVGRVNAYIFVI